MQIDNDRLEALLKREVPGLGGSLDLARVGGGQSNPTFFASFENRRLVIRQKPHGPVLPSAHAVDREFRVLAALGRVGIAVPKVLHFNEAGEVMGTPFYVMERVEGRIFHDSTLADVPRDERRPMYRSAAEMLAAIHKVDFAAAGLADFGKHGNFFSRQISRWTRQWTLSKTRPIPAIDHLVDWLPRNLPTEDQTTVVHGDFRIGNLMFHPTEPRIVAILDWELSTLGHPLADLAHTCIYSWHVTPNEYGGMLGVNLESEGLPTLADFAEDYYRASGQRERLNIFHIVLAMFRNAVIFQGIASRAEQGNASNANAAEVGRLAEVFASRAVALVEQGVSDTPPTMEGSR
ncbi:MAG: phosphotransferase family protein [Rhizobiaceae bacterium]